jgi:hypothetical protein
MSDAVTTSEDGRSVTLTCQEPDCGAVSAPIPITPALNGIFWCGVCGEWAFDFDVVGLTEEEMWPDGLDLTRLAGPLGPDGDAGGRVPPNVNPRWKLLG